MSPYLPVIAFIIAAVALSIATRKLTVTGGIAGGLLAFLIYLGAGYTGLALLAAFFIGGTVATHWKIRSKEEYRQVNKTGKRDAAQVLANGGIPALFGLLAWQFPSEQYLPALIAASFSSAMADTLSSELGTLYGSRFFNVITFRKDQKGLDGVISWEGTLIGIAGSVIIAAIYSIGYGWNMMFLWIIVAGTAGNLFDSLLGATLERNHLIGNDAVNMLNTLIAAGVMYLLLL